MLVLIWIWMYIEDQFSLSLTVDRHFYNNMLSLTRRWHHRGLNR